MNSRLASTALAVLVSAPLAFAQAGDAAKSNGLAVSIASPRTSLSAFETIPLKITVTNESRSPSATFSRADVVGRRSLVAASYDRKGQWMKPAVEGGEGSVELRVCESWTVSVGAESPEVVAKNLGAITVQWVGNGSLKEARSNELTMTLRAEKNPIATLDTSEGTIILELWPDKAPNHVANLITLARAGFYNGLLFHRVISGFMVQTGCPKGDGTGDPGYKIPAEFNDASFMKGTLGMARRGDNVDSAGSQFFICVADRKDLDNQYTAFGKVLEGQDIADKISNVPRDTQKGDRPYKDVVVRKVTVATAPDYKLPEVKKAGAPTSATPPPADSKKG